MTESILSNRDNGGNKNFQPLAMRPREAAKALSISERHLWQLTHDGCIPCARVGTGKRKTVLYSVPDLQTWLSNQSSKPEEGSNGTC